MKILVIGGTGTIGKKIVEYFSKDHEVLIAGRSSKDYKIDIGYIRSVMGRGTGEVIRIYS